jgi:hypothetical protein
VGIGTVSPDGLQINSSLGQETSRGVTNIRLGVLLGSPRIVLDMNGYTPVEIDNYYGSFRIFSPNATKFTVTANGNVGIGTPSPDQKLTVNGIVHAGEVRIDLGIPAPDYVFEKDYSLPSLDQVKKYIDVNKHLPEVPSAREMGEKGVNVGEMNMLLLKKVEELTLYIIEQEKRIKQLEKHSTNNHLK